MEVAKINKYSYYIYIYIYVCVCVCKILIFLNLFFFTDNVDVFNWNHFEMRLRNLRINFLFIADFF